MHSCHRYFNQIQASFRPINKSDFIIDLHEGYGFNRISSWSVGSTLIHTQFKKAENTAKIMIKKLNKTIKNENYKFNLLKKEINNCTPNGSLGCYCQKNKKEYILVETTGQNDIQPLDLRVSQDLILIKTALKELNIN